MTPPSHIHRSRSSPAMARTVQAVRQVAKSRLRGFSILRRLLRRQPQPAHGSDDVERRLHAALGEAGCPVCRESADADRQWFQSFLYEGYQVAEAFRAVTASPGFCSRHGEYLSSMGAYAPIIADVHAGALHHVTGRLKLPVTSSAEPDQPLRCRACENRTDTSRRSAFFLGLGLQRLGWGKYGGAGMACLHHLPMLADRIPSSMIPDLVERHARRLDTMIAELSNREVAQEENALWQPIAEVLGNPPGQDRPILLAFADEHRTVSDPRRRLRARMADKSRCPVCGEMLYAWHHWVGWLADSRREKSVIEDLVPVCLEHLWHAYQLGNPRLQFELARQLLKQARFQLHRAERCLHPPAKSFRPWHALGCRLERRHGPEKARVLLWLPPSCPVCSMLSTVQDQALRLSGILLHEKGTRRALERGHGFCARHALQAVRILDRESGRILGSMTQIKFEAMAWELDEMIRKGAWSTRPEPRGDEMSAWVRGIQLVSGQMT